jgi:hypothetical protein
MKNLVSIVIPLYNTEISEYENISLSQCLKILKDFDIKFISPNNLKNSNLYYEMKGFGEFVFFDDRFFNSVKTYNELMLSKVFYNQFLSYDYVLIYQLDAFVFNNDLIYWIEKKYSYIGAPWFKGFESSKENNPFIGVGNGGFSLRNVKDCIKVLNSRKKIYSLLDLIKCTKKNNVKSLIKNLRAYFSLPSFKNCYNNDYSINEDYVFYLASKRLNFFKVPKADIAFKFSFELHPQKLYEMNNKKLPFGCHAWWKYDLKFYKKFINQRGYDL